MYVALKAQCNMLNIGDERIMHNSLMTISCHVYFVGHLLQKKKIGMSSSKLQSMCHRPTLLLLCTIAHEHNKINSPQSLYTATLHASTGGYALWTLSWRLSTLYDKSCIANNASRMYATCTTVIVRCVYVRMHECAIHKPSHLMYILHVGSIYERVNQNILYM